jgi:divalent metal cation (Fe/Co/Zn/Cd) transporter
VDRAGAQRGDVPGRDRDGILAHSAALIADGLDMLSDASVYAIALVAIGRSTLFKAGAAWWSGIMLLLLGCGLLLEVARRLFGTGEPQGEAMIAVSLVALAVARSISAPHGYSREPTSSPTRRSLLPGSP